MSKGICSDCGMIRWIRGSASRCKPCGYPIGPCIQCHAKRKLYVDDLCYLCYQDRQVRSKLLEKEVEWMPESDYPKYLFQLYLLFIRRYLLKYAHLSQAKQLSKLLIENPPAPILSWLQLYKLSERDQAQFRPSAQRGCAWFKIGFMLQELGVIPPKGDERGREFRSLLESFNGAERSWIDRLIKDLAHSGRAEGTIINQLQSIRYLLDWIEESSLQITLLQVNQIHIQNYIAHLWERTLPLAFVRKRVNLLRRFYQWGLIHKFILVNPCEKIQITREAPQLSICSPEQTQQLFQFVRKPDAPPEAALMIALVLYWGLTSADLAYAQLASTLDGLLQITLRRTARTKGRRYYNRPQTLTLPREPSWCFQLQKQFLKEWKQKYLQIKKTYPTQPLFFSKSGHSNRPLSTEVIGTRFKAATQLATGTPITVRVVRQTCGHVHSQYSDVSILTRLGWSPQFAFHYTWLPRTYIPTKTPT